MNENKNKYQRLYELTHDENKTRLFGPRGLFGFYNEYHKFLKIFAEYAWDETKDDGQIAMTLDSRGFVEYVEKREDLTDEEKKAFAEQIESLKTSPKREIKDLPPQENTLRNFALLLQEFNIGRHPEKIIDLYRDALEASVANARPTDVNEDVNEVNAPVVSEASAPVNEVNAPSSPEPSSSSSGSSSSSQSTESNQAVTESDLADSTERNHQNLPDSAVQKTAKPPKPAEQKQNSAAPEYQNYQSFEPEILNENITEIPQQSLADSRYFNPAFLLRPASSGSNQRVVVTKTSGGNLRKLAPMQSQSYSLNQTIKRDEGKTGEDLKNPLQLPVYMPPSSQNQQGGLGGRKKTGSIGKSLAKKAAALVAAGGTLPFFAPKPIVTAASLIHVDLFKKIIDFLT
ncbi:MAG: hypothetical protein AAB373_02985 [Patescibacteria group bacterium]